MSAPMINTGDISKRRTMAQTAPGTYRCDRCQAEGTAKRLPMGWHKRGRDHICKKCWGGEPAERSYVLRFAVSQKTLVIPPEFWNQQRARRLLWDGLCDISKKTMEQAHALRAQYAPKEAGAFERAEQGRLAAVEAVKATKGSGDAAREERARKDLKAATLAEKAARQALKVAAKTAGCDESPLWGARDAEIGQAATWAYRLTEHEGRPTIERAESDEDPDAWRLLRSNADDVIEAYNRAWSAWLSQKPAGRSMPRPHGLALGDRLRSVLRYTNGQTLSRFIAGTPSLSLTDLHPDRSGKGRIYHVRMTCGPAFVEGNAHIHRDLPEEDGAIRQVALIGVRLADRWTWSLQFTVRSKLVVRKTPGKAEAAAVDLRWRKCEDGPDRILAAEWHDTDGRRGNVILDLAHCDRNNRKAGLPGSWYDLVTQQRLLDTGLEATKAAVWKRFHGEDPFTQAWRLTRSARLLRAVRDPQYAEASDLLTAWESEHRRNWRRLGRLHVQLVARRDQLYYEKAHEICASARRVIIEAEEGEEQAMDLRQIIALPEGFGARQRQMLAPGRFRAILRMVAPQHGTEIVLIDKWRTSTTCPTCGGQALVKGAAMRRKCPKGHIWEQPTGACAELLARASGMVMTGPAMVQA